MASVAAPVSRIFTRMFFFQHDGDVEVRDQLAEQRRQLAEIERIRSLASSGSSSGSSSAATRSHAVVPPSGAERPANHLQINKIAQVRFMFELRRWHGGRGFVSRFSTHFLFLMLAQSVDKFSF